MQREGKSIVFTEISPLDYAADSQIYLLRMQWESNLSAAERFDYQLHNGAMSQILPLHLQRRVKYYRQRAVKSKKS
jgi:hypothetical protein